MNDFAIRVADIVISLSCLMLLAPILPLIALTIRLETSGPPLFRMKRVGKDGVIFEMYKFRTIYRSPLIVKDDIRVTSEGGFLRRYSLDELPQLINILKGDMSFVGPRPPTLEVFQSYDEYERGRLACKPGLTGLAQLRSLQEPDHSLNVMLDIYYSKNRSVSFYYRILFATIQYVFSGNSADIRITEEQGMEWRFSSQRGPRLIRRGLVSRAQSILGR
jgi:lipopolysaccharide/colanic/teichoic acid biosynthesis glycosyltransferase